MSSEEGPPVSQAFRLVPSDYVPSQATVALIVNDPSLLDYENENYQEYIITVSKTGDFNVRSAEVMFNVEFLYTVMKREEMQPASVKFLNRTVKNKINQNINAFHLRESKVDFFSCLRIEFDRFFRDKMKGMTTTL